MLTQLRIKNLALVENITIPFHSGLNIITGETGAGKSILMGALSLLLGERADKTLIRTGEEACGVEAVFRMHNPDSVNRLLDELGLPACEEDQLVIRRIVKAEGSGQNLVNDSPVTLQGLRRLGDVLVDMHGPHEHQSLLRPAVQLYILDAFGHLEADRDAYCGAYRAWRDLLRQKEELIEEEEDLEEKIDRLTYKVQELEEAHISEDEAVDVSAEHAVAGNAQRIMELAGGTMQMLTESEDALFDRVTQLSRQMGELSSILPEAEVWQQELQSSAIQLQELSATINRRVGDIDADAARLAWLDERLSLYQHLQRKYKTDVAGLIVQHEEACQKLQELSSSRERMAAIERETEVAHEQVLAQGMLLSEKRTAVSEALSMAVTEELKHLGFSHGEFRVHIAKADPLPSGLDVVDFGFAPNLGEEMKPLRMIASSGEISRVMLATKTVLAKHDQIPLLVFDEIDANLGGEMGHAVGSKLSAIAGSHQVICITHLPQVAIHGDVHYAVSKYVKDGRTISEVRQLEHDERVHEVTRMLGGSPSSDAARSHALELLAQK